MTRTVDGTPFEPVISDGVVEGVMISNASGNPSFDGFDVTVLGHGRPSLFSFTSGAIMVDFLASFSPDSCPCQGLEMSILYSPEGGFTSNVYDDLEAEAIVESVEELGTGVYRISGAFSGTFGLEVGIMDSPDPERIVVADAKFVVERLAEEVEAE